MEEKGEIVIYQTQDGITKLDVRLDGDTVWLSQEQMAQLFERDKSVITRHISNIYAEGELSRESTSAKNAFVPQTRERSYEITYYNLSKQSYISPSSSEYSVINCHLVVSGLRQRTRLRVRSAALPPLPKNRQIFGGPDKIVART